MIARKKEARTATSEELEEDLSQAIEKGLERVHSDRPRNPGPWQP